MQKRTAFIVLLFLTLAPAVILLGYQMRHSQKYEWEMQDPVPDPPDAEEKAEFAFARLRYRGYGGGGFGGGRRWGRSSWGIDSNRADRLFEQAVRRLTRVHSKSVEEVIDVDDGPVFDYPWLYAVEVGHWELSDPQPRKLREYLDRGGFLMVDDFHGTTEWQIFMASLQRVFPDQPVVVLPDGDAIFHTIYDLDKRFQVPGYQFVYSGRTFEYDGYEADWRAI